MRRETQLVHFESSPGDPFCPTSPPIYQTATFRQTSATDARGFDYTRSGNPTRQLLEDHIAQLERGSRAAAFGSGMAAINAVTSIVGSGEVILAGNDIYGGTYRLLTRVLPQQGVDVRFVDTTDLEAVTLQLARRPRLVLIETPTNPLLRITDMDSVAKLVHDCGGLLAVDNSLMSPYLQQPLSHGADIVLHSATKFLGGHSDVTAGVVVTRDDGLAEQIAYYQNAAGTGLAPFEAWLLLRGLKTLALRVEQQQSNAGHLIRFLSEHPRVTGLHYPDLPQRPGQEIHRRQSRGSGGVLCFETGSLDFSKKLVEATRLFNLTVSFGGVGSSISLPALMSHASIPPEVRSARDIPEDLIRVSTGIEHPDDLLEDFARAFDIAATEQEDGEIATCKEHAFSHQKS